MKTKTAAPTPKQLCHNFVNFKMNCDLRHNPTKILRLIHKNEDELFDISGIKKFFVDEKEKLAKDRHHSYEQYYDENIIPTLELLSSETKKIYSDVPEAPVGKIIRSLIKQALKDGHMFHAFKWNNYELLEKEGLLGVFHEFDTSFRGDIIACHKVNGKYVVIETEIYPFDGNKQRYKTNEPKEKQYYSSEIHHERLCMTNTVFNTFEAALFHTMCPNQYSAMNILFESQLKKDEPEA